MIYGVVVEAEISLELARKNAGIVGRKICFLFPPTLGAFFFKSKANKVWSIDMQNVPAKILQLRSPEAHRIALKLLHPASLSREGHEVGWQAYSDPLVGTQERAWEQHHVSI